MIRLRVRPVHVALVGALLAGVTAVVGACSSNSDVTTAANSYGGSGTNTGGSGNSGQGGTTPGGGGNAGSTNLGGSGQDASLGGAAGSAGAAGEAGSDSDANPDVQFGYDAPNQDSPLTPDSACAADEYEATLTPLDMYIMLDRSGSMVEPDYYWTSTGPGTITISGGDCDYSSVGTPLNAKWCYSIYALAGYFGSNTAAGNRAALQFYPQTGYSCNGQGNSLATPAVGFHTLPGGAQPLINALNAESPLGSNTPTKAALYGLTSFTQASQATGRIIIGILITDGVPNSCAPDDAPTLATIPAQHFAATGIRTYVIGMTGAVFSTLETIAEAGGAPEHTTYCDTTTSPCHFYNVGNGDPQVFIDVLSSIQKTAIGCTYDLPTTDGGLVDTNQVAVEYVPGSGPSRPLTKVTGPNACVADAWYYDTDSPPHIVLCPDTCSQVQADTSARVNILVGCQGN